MNKSETHVVTGMSRDLTVTRFNPNLVVDARNIRITSKDGNSTLLAVTNEKGTRELHLSQSILGDIIGHCVINDTLILFTAEYEGEDRETGFSNYIYKVSNFNNDIPTVEVLFKGNLRFDLEFPIETTAVFESENIQKVYWVDGKNQPRMINICKEYEDNDNDAFDFCQTVEFNHTFTVEKFSSGGEFPVGTIQYCFSYFNLNGQETSLIECSPLYYLSPTDRGLPADGKCNNSFKITIEGADPSFEYIRLYSIIRTSENATPNCRIVGDYRVSTFLNITDEEEVLQAVEIPSTECYIFDTSNGEKTLLSNLYPEASYSNEEITLSSTKYILDNSTGEVYYLQDVRDNSKRWYIYVEKYGSPWIITTHNQGAYNRLMKANSSVETVGAITVTDNGTVGSTIDPTSLYFIGGKSFIAGTLAQKDNTLFLGDLKTGIPSIGNLEIDGKSISELSLKESLLDSGAIEPIAFIEDDYKKISSGKFYDEEINNKESSIIKKAFKTGENYRLGFIAQYKTGEWSDAVWLGDVKETACSGGHFFYNGVTAVSWNTSSKRPGFKITLPQSLKELLQQNEFISVAPVVVFPKDSERAVVCQGVISGTVFNVRDRADNSPFVQADWRFRWGYNWDSIDHEIQCNECWNASHCNPVWPYEENTTTEDFVNDYHNYYYRDPSVVTFHSPDIEFNENISDADLEGTYLEIVGFSNSGFSNASGDDYGTSLVPEQVAVNYLDSDITDFYIRTEENGTTLNTLFKLNYYPTEYAKYHNYDTDNRFEINRENLCYPGVISIGATVQYPFNNTMHGFACATYIWGTGAPVKFTNVDNNNYSTFVFSNKINRQCTSEFRYGTTTYFDGESLDGLAPYNVPIFSPVIFDSDNVASKKIKAVTATNSNKEVLYYGNIDKVITNPFALTFFDTRSSNSPSEAAQAQIYETLEAYCSLWNIQTTSQSIEAEVQIGNTSTTLTQNSPVRIKYKSTKHAVLSLSSSTLVSGGQAIPPTTFWNPSEFSTLERKGLVDDALVAQDAIYKNIRNSVLIGELRRDTSTMTLFGGKSLEAFSNNIWIKCGESAILNTQNDVVLEYREGDTYFGRFDCLKTYPFTQEDACSIVSIYSTELESRVNLDLRYDKNRGLTDNTLVTPQNFNLFNRAGYDQINQFFTYQSLNTDRYTTDYFPNMVTWSLEKSFGEDVDIWTSIPLTSTHTLDGDKGRVTKLITWADNIFAFQERGFAQLLYNSRVQIPVSDGQPIEITNNMKMAGKRYISQNIGCFNKWSVISTPLGIYFIDDINKGLYTFNGQLGNLSQTKGFDTWMDETAALKVWNPYTWENIVTYYDPVNKEVYFSNEKESLVFSEKLNSFTSFVDYNKLRLLEKVKDKTITFRRGEQYSTVCWEFWKGNYNSFFGEVKPYWLTFISNTDPTVDKIYNTLDWRSTTYTNTDGVFGTLKPLDTFDTIRVWNDYQDTLQTSLELKAGASSNLKKKFNVFRAQIPRDKRAELTGSQRDRIRSPWAYVQLAKVKPNYDLMVFNDLTVNFFE